MPGNRNGASDRGGRFCDDYSHAKGWRGCQCPERLKKLQAADEQLSNDTLNDAMDCFKNKKAELAERAFGKVLNLTSRRFNPKAFFEAKVPHPHPTPPHPTPAGSAGCDSAARPSPAVWGAAQPIASCGGPWQATPTLPSLVRGRNEL